MRLSSELALRLLLDKNATYLEYSKWNKTDTRPLQPKVLFEDAEVAEEPMQRHPTVNDKAEHSLSIKNKSVANRVVHLLKEGKESLQRSVNKMTQLNHADLNESFKEREAIQFKREAAQQTNLRMRSHSGLNFNKPLQSNTPKFAEKVRMGDKVSIGPYIKPEDMALNSQRSNEAKIIPELLNHAIMDFEVQESDNGNFGTKEVVDGRNIFDFLFNNNFKNEYKQKFGVLSSLRSLPGIRSTTVKEEYIKSALAVNKTMWTVRNPATLSKSEAYSYRQQDGIYSQHSFEKKLAQPRMSESLAESPQRRARRTELLGLSYPPTSENLGVFVPKVQFSRANYQL